MPRTVHLQMSVEDLRGFARAAQAQIKHIPPQYILHDKESPPHVPDLLRTHVSKRLKGKVSSHWKYSTWPTVLRTLQQRLTNRIMLLFFSQRREPSVVHKPCPSQGIPTIRLGRHPLTAFAHPFHVKYPSRPQLTAHSPGSRLVSAMPNVSIGQEPAFSFNNAAAISVSM